MAVGEALPLRMQVVDTVATEAAQSIDSLQRAQQTMFVQGCEVPAPTH